MVNSGPVVFVELLEIFNEVVYSLRIKKLL